MTEDEIATACGGYNAAVRVMRKTVIEMIELVNTIPPEQRTPAMQRMLDSLTRAIEEYDRG